MNHNTLLVLAAITALNATAPCQDPTPADPSALRAAGLREATVQSFDVPAVAEGPLALVVHLDGVPHQVNLDPFDNRAEGFAVHERTPTGLREVEAPPLGTMRGTLAGRTDSLVAANLLVGGGLEGVILTGTERWWIQPLSAFDAGARPSDHLVFHESAILDASTAGCGVTGVAPDLPNVALQTGGQILSEVEIAVECDYEFFLSAAGSSPFAALKATQQFNLVGAIYEAQLGIRLLVYGPIVIVFPGVYPAVPTGSSAEMLALLNAVAIRWNTTYAIQQRDVVHLLSGKGSFNTPVVGYAYIGAVCNVSTAYAVSRVVSPLVAQNTTLVAHELGHNFGATHNGNQIMNALIGTSSTFSAVSQNQIAAYTSSVSCLDAIFDASFSTFGAGCPGSNGITPSMSNTGLPLLTQTFSYDVSGTLPNTVVVLYVGFSNEFWGAAPLPGSLAPFGMPGCNLLVSPDLTYSGLADAAGNYSRSFTVPNDPSLLSACVHAQALPYDPSVNENGFSASNGGTAVIGNR